MNASLQNRPELKPLPKSCEGIGKSKHFLQESPSALGGELAVIIGLLGLLNASLLRGHVSERFIFWPDKVWQGEWWRILTHSFVHVNWYHLFLDASAFLILYSSLGEVSRCWRLLVTGSSAAGSLLISWIFSPTIALAGLCGLSGAAHGLMAAAAVTMTFKRAPAIRVLGVCCFALLIAKCLVEAVAGHAVFDFMHQSMVGIPIVICHGGGVLGALPVALVMARRSGGSAVSRAHEQG